jgi:hypothetical protein
MDDGTEVCYDRLESDAEYNAAEATERREQHDRIRYSQLRKEYHCLRKKFGDDEKSAWHLLSSVIVDSPTLV